MIKAASHDADRPLLDGELDRVEHPLERAERRGQEDRQQRQRRGLEQDACSRGARC